MRVILTTLWAVVRRVGLLLGAAAVLAAAGLGGCGNGGGGSGSRVTVVATTTQVADLVRNVGGRRVDVHQILGPNADPHEYEPRPSDVKSVADAALVVRSGGDVDDWLGDVIDNAGGDAPVLTLSDHVRTRKDNAGDVDPHWWQDPRNAELAVRAIRGALTSADHGGAAAYRRNAARYLDRLERLDRQTAACIDRIAPRLRKLVTTHDALGYYAARYGLEVIGAVIPSLSTQAQPSAGDIQRLVDQIERTGVKAIYPESSINPKLEQAIARESGATTGAPLWADTLGPQGSTGATYIDSIAANTAAIVDGLSGGDEQCEPGR
jgi:zinc/manganese transport system substrate-binding protein